MTEYEKEITPESANWGPDKTRALDETQVHTVKVPANARAVFRFSADAWWENAVIVYPDNPRSTQVYAERGNYSRSLADWPAPVTPREVSYMITGWHKDSPPRARNPWHQSKIQVNEESDRFHEVAFEDVHSSSGYDDMRVTVTIQLPGPEIATAESERLHND